MENRDKNNNLLHRIHQSLRTRPAKVTFTYVVGAALWILTSSYLLPQTVSDPELQELFEIAKGLLFVVITGSLLYVTLRSWVPEEAKRDVHSVIQFKPWDRIRLITAALVLLLFLPLLILLIYLVNAPALEREGLARLQGKAQVQAIHIENWLKERNGDAEVLYHNFSMSDFANNIQNTGDSNSLGIVTEYLQEIQKNYDYESIILLDKNGKTLLSIGKHTTIPSATMALLNEARKDGQIKHLHHFMLDSGHLHTDYIIPLTSPKRKGSRPSAFIIMRSKLNDVLALISQVSHSDMTDDDVLLLNVDSDKVVAFDARTGKLDHTVKQNQLQKNFPIVIATHGNPSGTVITKDHHETMVLAAWQRISGTDWYILAKADRNKVLAPLWSALSWVVLVGTFFIVAIITLLHLLWKKQEHYQRLERLARDNQTDQLLKHFFEIPLVGMAIWSANSGRWIRFNDYLCEMLGYTREKLNALNWQTISHPADDAKEEQKLKEIRAGKVNSYSLEKRLLRIDGSVLYTNVDVHCVRNDKDKEDILVATIKDITAYKHTIEALRESETRFQSIFDGVLDGIALADKETGAFIAGNTTFCNMLGYTKKEIASMSFRDIHPEDTSLKVEEEFALVTAGKVSIIEDTPVLRKDGSIFTADIKGGMITVGDREYILGVFRDTSDRNAMIQALADNESRLTTLINTIPDLIWLKDTNGVFLLCNTIFEKVNGAHPGEIIGKTDYDLVDKEMADLFRENDLKTMRSGKPTINEETVTFVEDGHQIMMETIKSPVSDRHGNLIGILGIGRDITQRKDYENRLHRLSQFYAALSQCNETIIRSSDENELLQEICRISVQITQIKAAWVGFIDKNDGILRWVAGSGEGNEESTSANNAFGDKNDVLNSPFYQAIKMGQAIWFQDLHSDELNESFREMAKAHNYQSAASLPLHREGAVVGVLNLYANVEQAFDEDVRQLLSEMAVDISFALDNFILEEHRITSEKSLLESEQRFRGLVEQSLSGIYIIQDGKYVYANPRLAEILGFTSENDLVGKSITHFIVPEDRDTVTTQLHNLMNRKSSHIAFEARVKRSDGELVDIGVHGALASHLGRPAAIGLVQDVTDKKRAEEQLNTYVEKLQASLMQTVEVANILSEMRDPYTSGHERRVAEIAVAIGRELELDEQQLEGLRVAGYLHDIGKINIPSEILAKPSKLTELEYEIIKGHPEAGFNVLKDVDFPWPVAQVARHHHERINGSGYPDGLKGDEIILEAKITAVADVVEAMGSHRPYRPGLGIEPALEEIERGKGTLYDPRVAEACLRLFREKGYSLPD